MHRRKLVQRHLLRLTNNIWALCGRCPAVRTVLAVIGGLALLRMLVTAVWLFSADDLSQSAQQQQLGILNIPQKVFPLVQEVQAIASPWVQQHNRQRPIHLAVAMNFNEPQLGRVLANLKRWQKHHACTMQGTRRAFFQQDTVTFLFYMDTAANDTLSHSAYRRMLQYVWEEMSVPGGSGECFDNRQAVFLNADLDPSLGTPAIVMSNRL